MNAMRYAIVLIAGLAAATTAIAELPVARLNTLFPAGGKTGTTFDVTITGQDLDDAAEIHFSNPAIVAKPKLNPDTHRPLRNVFTVQIGNSVANGVYESRFIGRFGISNSRAFAVGANVELMESEPNGSASTATVIPLNSVVNGRADANGVDYFKFTARKGQRILAECAARQIDSRMEPVLALYDSHGRELERNRSGGVLDFTAADDGDYLLRLHDFIFRGGDEYFYRLEIGTGPRIDYLFPPAGIAGTKGKYFIYGRNLPGAIAAAGLKFEGKTLEKLEVEIELPKAAVSSLAGTFILNPASSVVEGFEYRFTGTNSEGQLVVSNPYLISLADATVIAEEGSNGRPDQAQKLLPPCEFVGQFYPAGDRDWVSFDAKKGEIYWLEIFSHRLGLPTDPFLLVQQVSKTDKGDEKVSDLQEVYDIDTNIGGPEFNTNNRDLAWRFEAKQDGVCRLMIRDLFNPTQPNPGHVYRFAIRKPRPDFRLLVFPQTPAPPIKDKKEAFVWTPMLRRGETMLLKLLAFRRDDFNGEIDVRVEGLPPGVTAHPTRIQPGKTSGTLLLTADGTASSWTGELKVIGTAKVGETELVHTARGASILWNVPDYNNEPIASRVTRDVFLAVSDKDPSPAMVTVTENKTWEAEPNTKLKIPVKITRAAEFNEIIKLKPAGFPQFESLKEIDITAKDTNTTVEIDLAPLKLAPGYHTLFLQGQTKGKYRRLSGNDLKAAELAVTKAEEKLKEADKLLAERQAAIKKGTELVANLTKQADESESLLKSASERLVAASSATEKHGATEEVQTAKTSAEKETTELKSKFKASVDAKTEAAKSLSEAKARLAEVERQKNVATELAKELKEIVQNAQPKETTFTAYSAPITLKISASEKK
jgi:hypothetical protein